MNQRRPSKRYGGNRRPQGGRGGQGNQSQGGQGDPSRMPPTNRYGRSPSSGRYVSPSSGSYKRESDRQLPQRHDDTPEIKRSTNRLNQGTGGFGVLRKKSNTGAKLGTAFVILLVLGGTGGGYYFYNDSAGLLQHVKDQDDLAVVSAYVMAHKGVEPSAVIPLRQGLEKGRPTLKRACAKALGSTRNKENTPFLGEAVLNDADHTVRAAAVRAMGKNGDLNVENFVDRALADPHDDVKVAACEAVGDLQLGSGLPLMIQLLTHHNAYVKTAARENLERFLEPGRSFGDNHVEWRKWYEGEYD